MDVTKNAVWIKDCQGKEDFDFQVISCDTRYFPDYSVICSIIFLSCFHSSADEDGNHYSDGEDYTLLESDILYGTSKDDCRKIVKDWYNKNVPKALQMALDLLKQE
jgi:hypothetical protein